VVRKTEKMKRTPAILTIRLNPTGDEEEKQEWMTVEVANEGLLSTTRTIDSASVVEWAKETNEAAEWTTILLQYGNNEKLAKELSETIPGATVVYATEYIEPLEWSLVEVAVRRATRQNESIAAGLMKMLSPIEIVEKGLRVLTDGDQGLAAAYHLMSRLAPDWYKAGEYPKIRAPVAWEKVVTDGCGDDGDTLEIAED
jgi:hypothetical protein